MKRCADCKQGKPLAEFGANRKAKDGLKSYCRPCSAERQRAYVAANKEKVRTAGKRYYENNREAVLSRAAERYWGKPEKFREAARQYRADNAGAVRARDRKRYEANPDAKRNSARAFYAENRDKIIPRMRDYWSANKDQMSEYQKRYYRENKAAFIAYAAKRRADLLDRCSLLTTEKEKQIKALYAEAKRLTEETGVPHHVDHIVPLRGKTCSGLHVPSNLRVVPAQLNLSKGAKIDYELTPHAFKPDDI
jgi:hypothetical protein